MSLVFRKSKVHMSHKKGRENESWTNWFLLISMLHISWCVQA